MRKLKANISRIIIATLLVSFFVSCNTDKKVVSSFGKRKYTKGFYSASSPNKKSVLPVKISQANKSISTNNNINSSLVQRAAIPVNDKKNPIVTSLISIAAKEKKAPPSLPLATNVSKNIHTSPDGIPGHSTGPAASDSSGYDGIATAAMILGLAALFLLLGALVFSSVLFVEGSGDFYAAIMYLCALFATIFGFIGHKSERYRGRATAGKIIGLIILIGSLILLIALIIIFIAVVLG